MKNINKSTKFKSQKKGYFTIKELSQKFGKSQHTIRYWIKTGFGMGFKLKAKKEVDSYYPHEYFIKLEDWLDIPTWKREFKKFENKK